MRRVNCDQAYNMILRNKKILVLDLRHKSDYVKGHIPGAVNINAYDVSKEVIGFLNDKTVPIIVYCYSGSVSLGVCLILEDLGYKNVFDLQDITKWRFKLSSQL